VEQERKIREIKAAVPVIKHDWLFILIPLLLYALSNLIQIIIEIKKFSAALVNKITIFDYHAL
jgi:hypothetical protein